MPRGALTYEKVFAALNRARVRYLVVGGVAVGMHGFPRYTKDLDLLLDQTKPNLTKALRVLLRLGLRPSIPEDPLRFADPVIRGKWIREKRMIAFPWHHTRDLLFRVDVMVTNPIGFKAAFGRREKFPGATGVVVPVVSVNDLARMKRKAARPQDKEDLRMLELLREARRRGLG